MSDSLAGKCQLGHIPNSNKKQQSNYIKNHNLLLGKQYYTIISVQVWFRFSSSTLQILIYVKRIKYKFTLRHDYLISEIIPQYKTHNTGNQTREKKLTRLT